VVLRCERGSKLRSIDSGGSLDIYDTFLSASHMLMYSNNVVNSSYCSYAAAHKLPDFESGQLFSIYCT
jgi:hypothetical protein